MPATPNFPGRPFSDQELAVWQGLLRVHGRITRALDAALMEHHGLSVRAFDVLITLFNAPGGRYRMSDLAGHVMLSPSGLTRLITRLERECLVERQSDPDDARSYHVALTDAGLARLDQARPTHNAVIRTRLFDRLDAEDLTCVGAVWRKAPGEE